MSNKRSQQKMDAIRLRQAERQLGITPEKKRMMRKEARRQARRDRTDEYWRDPLPYRVYVRGLYSVCGGILVGVLFDRLRLRGQRAARGFGRGLHRADERQELAEDLGIARADAARLL